MRRHRTALLGILGTLLASACADAPPPLPPAGPAPPAPPTARSSPPSPAPTTLRRAVLFSRQPFGSSLETTWPDGTVTIAYDVHENGRGAHCDATVRRTADGTIASFEAHGHHELGTRIDETFAVDGGRARWKSTGESGDLQLAAPAFFVPASDCPQIIGMLAEVLLRLRSPLALLPSGQARLEEEGETTVQAAGQSKHLRSYALTGLLLAPVHAWMDDDGRWFGYVAPYYALVPEGWESAVGPLLDEQRRFETIHDERLRNERGHVPPAAGVALTHARVLDVERGRWLPDHTVLVAGDTIQAVGSTRTTKVPAGAEVVDLAGKAVLPGLWDMHAHLESGDGVLDVASGVTTVRDVGNHPDSLDDFKERFDAGTAVGPHVLRAGLVEGRGENAAAADVTATTEDEARAAVEFFAKRGYEQMKLYNSIKPELVPVFAREAHARGMTVTGHIPWRMLAHEAVDAGYDGIEHINMLFLNFFADHTTDTRTTKRFSLVGDHAASFDLASQPAQDFFAQLRKHHTVVDPTLTAFEPMFVARPGQATPGTEEIVVRLPILVQRHFREGGLPMEGAEELYARSWERVLGMVRALHDARVRVVVGTDELQGLMLHHELALYVRAGLKPATVLRDDTLEAARAMKLDKKTGSVEPGKVADLYVVDGDPLASIADVRKGALTVRSGVVYTPKDLYESAGVRP
jgi:hypothetical protein